MKSQGISFQTKSGHPVTTALTCHISLDDMQLYTACNAPVETKGFNGKQVHLCIRMGITKFRMFIWGGIQ